MQNRATTSLPITYRKMQIPSKQKIDMAYLRNMLDKLFKYDNKFYTDINKNSWHLKVARLFAA